MLAATDVLHTQRGQPAPGQRGQVGMPARAAVLAWARHKQRRVGLAQIGAKGQQHIRTHLKRRWPDVRQFDFHMHNARGMALPSIYSALRTLDQGDTAVIEGTLGGIGGGQYGGNGRACGMVATEDFMHMLEGMGIATGVDLDKLIDCVWMLERIIGRSAYGCVAKAGPRPTHPGSLFDPNMPSVESLEAAKHFRFGPQAYEKDALSPWKHPISGPYHQGPRAPMTT